MKASDFYDNGFVIVGSPKTVREQLVEDMKRFRVGHLLTLLHFGSMPTDLCKRNIDLFARDVLPHLEGSGIQYEDRWWPERLRAKRPASLAPWPQPSRIGERIMASPQVRRLRLWQDRIPTEVEIAGSGPPLVYLHGPWGLAPDRASSPGLPTTTPSMRPTSRDKPGDSEAAHSLDSWLDLVVYHGELLDALQLDAPAIVGHSFGGLLAAELAATAPKSVGRLVLIDPVGLWRDDLPVKNWMVLSDRERQPSLFAEPDGKRPEIFRGAERSRRARRHARAIDLVPGLLRQVRLADARSRPEARIHRIAAPTMIVWGNADRIIEPAYAQEFARRIAGAGCVLIDGAGHLPHLEKPETVIKAVQEFPRRLTRRGPAAEPDCCPTARLTARHATNPPKSGAITGGKAP